MADQIPVTRPTGRLDTNTSPALEKDLLGRLEQGIGLMILDLSGVTLMTSAGLRAILLAAKRFKGAGGRLVLCSLSKQVRQVFDATGCDALVEVFPSHEAAVAHLSMR